jgi:hydroxymethylbilane synthase
MSKRLRVITRRSDLALLQTSLIINPLLCSRLGSKDISIEIIPNDTIGDVGKSAIAIGVSSSDQANNKKKWVKDLENAVLANVADVAIHSAKDYPSDVTAGTILIPILAREDPRDVFVSLDQRDFFDLPTGSRIGTKSKRRQAQVRSLRPDLEPVEYTGNVMTRLRYEEMTKKNVAGIVLANAGLTRLGVLAQTILDGRTVRIFSIGEMLPASNQGILLAQCRAADDETITLMMGLSVPQTTAMWTAERAVLDALGADCERPLAVNAICDGNAIAVQAIAVATRGPAVIEKSASGTMQVATQLGNDLGLILKDEIDRSQLWA